MSDPIFRRIAEDRLSSPDQLEQAIRITGSREWLSLMALVLIVASATVWGFEGRVPTRVEWPGILVPAGGTDKAGALELQVFVPALQAQQLRPGMAVEVIAAAIRADQDGSLQGKVRRIEDFAAGDEHLAASLRDSPLLQTISAERPVIEVRVELMRDASTGGYLWSSGNGATGNGRSTKDGVPLKLFRSLPCVAKITLREEAPVTFIIPGVRRWMGEFQ